VEKLLVEKENLKEWINIWQLPHLQLILCNLLVCQAVQFVRLQTKLNCSVKCESKRAEFRMVFEDQS